MNQGLDYTHYPLSPALTKRVVNYLKVFRLFISLALIFAYFTGGLAQSLAIDNQAIAITALLAYLGLSLYVFVATAGQQTNFYDVAQKSLFGDIALLAPILFVFGGLPSGLGVLLIFVSATAAILLPLRSALFIASLATIAIIGEAFFGGLARAGQPENIVRAGLYGLTNFITAILSHVIAFWVRDYRLIAERQQQTLTRLEQINELIIRRMRNGVLAVDDNHQIQMMNESAWFLLGSPAATERILEDISPELGEAMAAWEDRPASEIGPLTLNASQAEVVPKFVSLPGDQDIRVLIFLEDNNVVAQRARELSANSLAKLSGSIAHEIRNPLAAVSNAAQLLGESENLAEADGRLIDIIRNQSRRMNGIVENILQLSRQEKSRPELLELTHWLQSLVDEFRSALNASEFELEEAIEQDEVLVMFDRSQLHQVLWKLMENAVSHAGKENADPRVTLRTEVQRDTGYCVVSVEDNGPGIDEEHIGQVFEPFYTTRKMGSGLGLYIARQLCEANRAELTVDSTPGWKTRFHIRLALTGERSQEALP